MSAARFTVVVAQVPGAAGDRRAAISDAAGAAPDGADLVVLPYLGAIPYVPAALDRAGYGHAERLPYATVEAVRRAVQRREATVAVSFYEVVAEGVFYSSLAVIAADGTTAGTYRQAHALNRPRQHEQLFFQPGTTRTAPVFRIGEVRVGFLLGGDLWVPEAARLLALGGAEVIVGVTATRSADGGLAAAMARVRAAENGRAVVLASRAGHGLDGRGMAFGPDGEPLAEGNPEEPWFLVPVDLGMLADHRRRDDPLRMRRPHLYRSLVHGDGDRQ